MFPLLTQSSPGRWTRRWQIAISENLCPPVHVYIFPSASPSRQKLHPGSGLKLSHIDDFFPGIISNGIYIMYLGRCPFPAHVTSFLFQNRRRTWMCTMARVVQFARIILTDSRFICCVGTLNIRLYERQSCNGFRAFSRWRANIFPG